MFRPSLEVKMKFSKWGSGVQAAIFAAATLPLLGIASDASAHGMAGKDAAFVASSMGPQILPFFYLGAKHMAAGYDHLLFVIGTVFFLYQLKHVAIYVTTFSIEPQPRA